MNEDKDTKLVTLEKLDNIQPAQNSDNLAITEIDGWQVVFNKNEFIDGDLVIFCRIDTQLPEHEEFSFLEKMKYRVKSVKLRGNISQGLLFPIHILSKFNVNYEQKNNGIIRFNQDSDNEFIHIGDEISNLIGAIKYERPHKKSLGGEIEGQRPPWVPKTDEEQLQNIPKVLKECAECNIYISEKLDGSSASYYIKDGKFGVCSRRLEVKEDESNAYWAAAYNMSIRDTLTNYYNKYNKNLTIQLELVGPGIQGNPFKLKDYTVFLFDAFNIDEKRYFSYDELVDLANELELLMVPVIDDSKKLKEIGESTQSFLQYTMGATSMLNTDTYAEGYVFRSVGNEFSETLKDRLSFKVININY